MKKVFKILGWFLVAIVLLVIALALTLPFFIDPNDYKDEISTAVREETEREFVIRGDIELSVFPWLGVAINDANLGNAQGFEPEHMATLQRADVRVKLLPLLRRKVEVGRITVHGLQLNLVRNADGSANWDDLVETGAAEPPAAQLTDKRQDLLDLSIDGFELRDTSVTFTDAAVSRQYRLQPLNLQTGAFRFGAPFELHLDGSLAMTNPGMQAEFVFDSVVSADPQAQTYLLENGKLLLSASGGPIPLETLEAQLAWSGLRADLATQTAELEQFVLDAHGAHLEADLSAQNILGDPAVLGTLNVPGFTPDAAVLGYLVRKLPEGVDPRLLAPFAFSAGFEADLAKQTAVLRDGMARGAGLDLGFEVQAESILADTPHVMGTFNVAEFSPTKLLVALGQSALVTADPEALSRAQMEAAFKATPNSVELAPLALTLDQTSAHGSLAVTDLERQALAFNLTVDELDADRYLPPAAQQAPEAAAKGSIDDIKLPTEPVRALDVDGSLRIGKLRAFGINSSDIRMTLRAQGGRVQVHPARASLYGGAYTGDIVYDARTDRPRLSMDEQVQGVQLGPMLQGMFGVQRLSGTAAIDVKLAAQGATVGDMRKTLDGNVRFALKDGALEGVNIWQSISDAYAKLKGREPAATDAPNRTEFADLSGSGTVKQGVLKNDDLKARLPFLEVSGAGTLDLVREAIDYRLQARVLSRPELSAQELDDLKGTTIPVRLIGTFSDISVRPDVAGVLKEKAKDKVDEKVEEKEEEIKEKLKDKLKDVFG